MATILLAEDDAAMRGFIAKALEKSGHTVTSLGDGLEALHALQQGPYDLLLTDIVMPGMDGIALSTQAARLHPSMKIMFITGFAAMTTQDPGLQSVPHKVIAKPFHLGNLTQEVEEILKSARA